jgi:hypothetical protein
MRTRKQSLVSIEQLKVALRRMRVGVSSGDGWENLVAAMAAMALRSSSAPETKTTLSTLEPLMMRRRSLSKGRRGIR